MYNLRERRTRYFKQQNGVVRRKQRSQGDSCLSEVSSVNTLVDDDDDEGVYSDSNCGEGEDPHFSSCEENTEMYPKDDDDDDDDDDAGEITNSKSIPTEPQNESEKPMFNRAT